MFYLVTSVHLFTLLRGLKELSDLIKWWILTACLTLKTDIYIDFFFRLTVTNIKNAVSCTEWDFTSHHENTTPRTQHRKNVCQSISKQVQQQFCSHKWLVLKGPPSEYVLKFLDMEKTKCLLFVVSPVRPDIPLHIPGMRYVPVEKHGVFSWGRVTLIHSLQPLTLS